MSAYRSKLVRLMEGKFGVDPEFVERLGPVLDRIADTRPSAREWEELLRALASAFDATQRSEVDTLDESRVLIRSFVSELKKMDESLKVLSAFVDRLRDETDRDEDDERVLH